MDGKYLRRDDEELSYIFHRDVCKNDDCLFAWKFQNQVSVEFFQVPLQIQLAAYSYCYGNLLGSDKLRNTLLFLIRHCFKTQFKYFFQTHS